MCGIAGFSLNPNEDISAKALAISLTLGIEERGRDATGAAWFDNGDLMVSKAPLDATEFVKHLAMPNYTGTAILHTRWASQGTPSNNGNNHPIDVVGLVGTHNGVVSNDREILARLAENNVYFRQYEVDSEAPFAALAHTGLHPTEVLPVVRGSAALAWLVESDLEQTLHLARVSSSPLIIAATAAGSVVYASTEKALRRAEKETGIKFVSMMSLAEGTYLTVTQKTVTETIVNEDTGATEEVENTYTMMETHTFDTVTRTALSETEKKALNLA